MKTKYIHIIQIITILLLLYLSLWGGDGMNRLRSLDAIRNLGHIVLFALISHLLLHAVPWIRKKKRLGQIIWIGIFTLAGGLFIETFQYLFSSGIPDLGDMGRNFIGSAIPFVFSRSFISKTHWRRSLQLALLIFIAIQMAPAIAMALDEYRAQKEFPVLSDFESSLELSRWYADGELALSDTHVIHGKQALKIPLPVVKYSGISFRYFPSDWSDYHFLHFSLFVPDSLPKAMICRIHDKDHYRNGYKYSDRFNKHIELNPGWNKITIDLNEVRQAPKNRKMDLSAIRNLALFTVNLPKKRVIYLDYIYLSNNRK